MRRITGEQSVCHVVGCHVAYETRIQSEPDDVASNISRHVIGCQVTHEGSKCTG
jgi:hypothetical protein